jgi:hypothetical protein
MVSTARDSRGGKRNRLFLGRDEGDQILSQIESLMTAAVRLVQANGDEALTLGNRDGCGTRFVQPPSKGAQGGRVAMPAQQRCVRSAVCVSGMSIGRRAVARA